VDEAAYVDQDLIYSTTLPVAKQEKTSMVLISTPKEENHFFSTLSHAQYNGKPVFRSILLSRICDICRKLPIKQSMECNHLQHMVPASEFSEKAKMIQSLYEEGRTSALSREYFGIPQDDETRRFRPEWLVSLFGDESGVPFSPLRYTVKTVFITCDPTGGGQSRLAFCAFAKEDGVFKVRDGGGW
jgi:hypothetical protein